MAIDNFVLGETETIEINSISLPVLPTDVNFFADNKLVEEVYIRAPGAITFRSRHTDSVLSMSFAFPVIELALPNNYDKVQRELALKGLKLIASLDSYPFCFIRSNRVKSYLGSHNLECNPLDPNSPKDDEMMFGVKKITVRQDARVPGLLLLDLQLLYNNHRILTPSMTVNYDGVSADKVGGESGQTSNIGFNTFVENIGKSSVNAALGLLQSSSEYALTDNFMSQFELGQVRLKVPRILNLEEYGVSLKPESLKKTVSSLTNNDLTGNIDNLPKEFKDSDVKFLRMPDPYVQPTLYVNVNEVEKPAEEHTGYETSYPDMDPEDIAISTANLNPLYAIVWLEDSFAYEHNINPIQSVVVEKERSFAPQIIGAFQHPFLQYMGKYPARLTINSAYQASNYDDSTSFHYLFKLLSGVIDSNATVYPQASAFNYIKVEALPTLLLNSSNYIPHQSEIAASSSTSNMETFSCLFIENAMDKMLESAQVKIGRRNISYESNLAVEQLITEYITNVGAYIQSGKKMTEKEEAFHDSVLESLIRIVASVEGKPYEKYAEEKKPETTTETKKTTKEESKDPDFKITEGNG